MPAVPDHFLVGMPGPAPTLTGTTDSWDARMTVVWCSWVFFTFSWRARPPGLIPLPQLSAIIPAYSSSLCAHQRRSVPHPASNEGFHGPLSRAVAIRSNVVVSPEGLRARARSALAALQSWLSLAGLQSTEASVRQPGRELGRRMHLALDSLAFRVDQVESSCQNAGCSSPSGSRTGQTLSPRFVPSVR